MRRFFQTFLTKKPPKTGGSRRGMTPIDIHSWMTNPLELGAEPLKDSRTYLTPLSGSRIPSHFR